jgi:hypothetical protein
LQKVSSVKILEFEVSGKVSDLLHINANSKKYVPVSTSGFE